MKTLTYETYVTDPAVREAVLRAALRARSEALSLHLVLPLARFCGRLLAIRGVRMRLDPRAAAT